MNSTITLTQAAVIPCMSAVDINGSGEAVLPTANGKFVGIVQSPSETIGDAIPVIIERCIEAQAGGVFSAGDYLAVDASGHFVKAGDLPTMSSAPTNTEVAAYTAALAARVAVALEASTAPGDYVQILRI